MTYGEKLKHPNWQKKRAGILLRDNYTCQLCGDKETTLHVHHTKYHNEPWDIEDECLITYCEDCHSVVEYLKKNNPIVSSYIKAVKSRFLDEKTIALCMLVGSEAGYTVLIFHKIKGENIVDFSACLPTKIIRTINDEIVALKSTIENG